MEFDSFVLAASTGDLNDEPAARQHADAVEFRMDLATDPLADLAEYGGQLPVIATNRPETEGGDAPDGPGRLDALQAAAEHPAVKAVDVELQAIEFEEGLRVVDHAREHGAAVIASVHDFETTPDRSVLDGLLERAAAAGDVGKLAVTASSLADVPALLAATWERTAVGDRVATMAMGEAGRHSRAVAPIYGSRIGYAPVDPDGATAPGQYDLATLRSLVELLRGRNPASRAED